MNVLLVNLDWPGLVSTKTYKIHLSLPPLDLVLLENEAKRFGHRAEIFDCFARSSRRRLGDLQRMCADVDWIVLATTPYHMWQCPNSEWEWLREAIGRFPSEKTVLTGLHGSVFPEKTLRETGAFALVRGEPEAAVRQFLAGAEWRDCMGVSYLQGGAYRENPPTTPVAMDDLVVRDYTVEIGDYSYFLLGRRTGVFEASRGCPWKCTFCDQEMYGWAYRTKTPALFAEEVARSVRQSGMETAYFFDLEFTVSKKRTVALCEELVQSGVPNVLRWCCQTRADTVNEEVLDALKAAGCRLIHFGVESANEAVLKATNKKVTLEKIERGVRLAKAKGLETACFFMFGLPEERPEEFENTIEFARALNPTYASFHFAIPFPGTPLYERYVAEKQVSWGSWPATYFDAWDHPRIERYIHRAYRRFYLTPRRFEVREFLARLRNFGGKLAYFRAVS